MNFECSQCKSPISREGQRFCNRCGNDLRSFYESLGITIPVGSAELPSAKPDDIEPKAPENNDSGDAKVSLPVDANIVEPTPIGHTIAIEMPEITVETTPPESSTEQKAVLRILLPSSDVFDRELKKVETQIGKGPRNDIVLADPAVSTSHAVIRHENNTYSIKDLGSRNGTLVNGKKITTTEVLTHGDVIGMGTTKLTFRLGNQSETEVIVNPDITAPIPSNRLPLSQDSLAIIFVRGGVMSQSAMDQVKGAKAKGRRLYRAILEEGLANEVAMRDAMSRAFAIPTIDLAKVTIDDNLASKISPQLAKDKWIFPVEESSNKVILAVADPTDQASLQEVKTKFYHPQELRLATPTDILNQIDKHFGPKLVGVLPTGEKIEYNINKPEIEVGKAAHNQIVLTDPTVSNTHAVILSRDGGFSIVDLGSRNGTFVNGDRLTTHAQTLKHGDSVQMGQTLWTFRNLSETPENVTAVLSLDALEEIRKRAGIFPSPVITDQQPALSASSTPQPVGHQVVNPQPVATPVEVKSIAGVQPANAGQVDVQAVEDDSGDKKKKKKAKQKEERERIKAAYIRAVGGILATVLSVILTVLLTIYINHSMRSQPPSGTTTPSGNTVTPGNPASGTKVRLSNAAASIPFDGGKYEASGSLQIPGTDGIFFVDNSKEDFIYWMPLDATGNQASAIQPINFGVKVSDPEGIAYGGSFFYVMSSLSFPDLGDQNALVRFAIDPQNRTLQGNAEVMTGIREFLVANVPELKTVANLNYDQGGINIEGLAWDAVHERLLVGFRSPLVNGKALLVPLKLKDPRGSFSTDNLIAPESTIQISLNGLGIRDIDYDPRAGVFFIIAGSIAQGDTKEFILFEWSGETDAAPKELARLDQKMKPEGVTRVRIGGRDYLFIVGDSSAFTKFDLAEGQ